MSSEVTSPTLTGIIPSTQQYRDRYRPTQPDFVDDAFGGTGLQVTNAANVQVSVANGGAVIQACRYDLTGGPLLLNVAPNLGALNRFDIVCLTYDPAHVPVVYCRIRQGTPGTGLPGLSSYLTGVWDFPLAHYEKQPGGNIVNFRDRRCFTDGAGGMISADDLTGISGVGWFPPAYRTGQLIRFMPSGNTYTFDGRSWTMPSQGVIIGASQTVENTSQTMSANNYVVGSVACSATITGPVSGAVMVTVEGRGSTAGDNLSWLLGYEVRLTNNAGTIVSTVSDDLAAQCSGSANGTSMNRFFLSGLTPGQLYYAQTMHRSSTSGSSITLINRQLILEPVR
jgi:hypothetical protein